MVDTNPVFDDETGWPPDLPVRGVGKVGVSSACSNATELRPAVRNVQGRTPPTPKPKAVIMQKICVIMRKFGAEFAKKAQSCSGCVG